MTPAQRRYVAIETAISVAINTLISIAIFFLVFGGMARIDASALIRDAAPQSFMIALMSSVVPTLLTRRRLRAGTIGSLPRNGGTPMRLAVRALVVAITAAAIGVLLHRLLLPVLAPHGLAQGDALILKAAYGALVALLVTPWMLRLALAEAPAPP